jgi:hypothetical protein
MKKNGKPDPNPSVTYLHKVEDVDPTNLFCIPPGTKLSYIYGCAGSGCGAESKPALRYQTPESWQALLYAYCAPMQNPLPEGEIEAILKDNIVFED